MLAFAGAHSEAAIHVQHGLDHIQAVSQGEIEEPFVLPRHENGIPS